jgi:hypothetical protein
MNDKINPVLPPSGLAGYGPLALQPRASTGRWEEFSYGGPPGIRSYFCLHTIHIFDRHAADGRDAPRLHTDSGGVSGGNGLEPARR